MTIKQFLNAYINLPITNSELEQLRLELKDFIITKINKDNLFTLTEKQEIIEKLSFVIVNNEAYTITIYPSNLLTKMVFSYIDTSYQ